MSYDVGTHVDLSHLNGGVAATFQNALDSTQAEVGTSFTFTKEGHMARRIPVLAL